MNRGGFTLLELTITMSLTVVVGGLAMAAIQSTNTSISLAETKSDVQSDLRDTLRLMQLELETASTSTNGALLPPLSAIRVETDPDTGEDSVVTFQTPLDNTGQNWSRPITFAWVNEDGNGDGLLSEGEDLDDDGILDRHMVRRQDLNADGDTDDAGEERIVGAANRIDEARFGLNEDILTVTLSASELMEGRRGAPVRVTVTTRVYLAN